METIDRNNYETFFIDYLDGSLPIDEIDLLLDFLTENPNLAEELKGLEKIKLESISNSQNDFSFLKKNDLDLTEIFEETCIRSIENELSPNELKNFEEYLLQNKESQDIFELFRSTVSEPDPFIIYDQKNRLKKKTIVFKYWYAVAAIFILGLMFFIPSDQKPKVQSVVQVAKYVETKALTPVKIKSETEPNRVVSPVKKHALLAKCETVQEKIVEITRAPEFIEPMNPLFSEVIINQVVIENIMLMPVEKRVLQPKKDYSKYLTIKEFIAQKIHGAENNGSIEKVALNTLKKVSGEKFDYTTSSKGKIKKLEFNSSLIAFSIPLKSSGN
jgi:hypothetical protein